MLAYAKQHFRVEDGPDSRSFSTGTMKGTLMKFASSGAMKTKLPEHMKESKDKEPVDLTKEMLEKIAFVTVS